MRTALSQLLARLYVGIVIAGTAGPTGRRLICIFMLQQLGLGWGWAALGNVIRESVSLSVSGESQHRLVSACQLGQLLLFAGIDCKSDCLIDNNESGAAQPGPSLALRRCN